MKMRGLSVGVREDEDQGSGKRGINGRGDSWAGLLVHAHHRRSKSASDRNSNVFRAGFQSSKKDENETNVSQPSTSAPRGHDSPHESPTYLNKNMSSKHRASLEKDIEQLQSRLQQEKSMRLVLERAMGRASSTLSPGHRHFAAQTKELIAEIESLEEEVANREQHVLSMYRTIFEQSASRAPSEQNSSMDSPAHPKLQSRKHPSIISSAFCSSKKFPFRPLQALVSINDAAKRSAKSSHAPVPNGKPNFDSPKTGTKPMEVSAAEKTSLLRTLRDHLHQCPSKLSEEMVQCMAVVYCWLRSTASAASEKHRSPFLSRSSTNIVQPRRGVEQGHDWSGKSMLEILCISTDKSHFSHASIAINNYRVLVEQLEKVNVNHMESDAKTAFWINVYNALIMHAYLAYGIPNSSLRRLALFHKAAYNIGGRIISANAIEHSVFCFRTPRIGWWLETFLLAALRKKSGEDRGLTMKFGLPESQPLVCFALCTGAFSDPVLRVYTAQNLRRELEEAKRDFLQSNIVVKKSRKVFAPKLLERFAREASLGSDNLLKWVTENVDKKLGDSIQKCGERKKASQIIEWVPCSTRFRYVFSKGLTEKPWWL